MENMSQHFRSPVPPTSGEGMRVGLNKSRKSKKRIILDRALITIERFPIRADGGFFMPVAFSAPTFDGNSKNSRSG